MAQPTPRPIDRASLAVMLRANPPAQPRPLVFSRELGEGCRLETIEVESAAGVFLPAYLFLPETESALVSDRRPLLILAEPGGRTSQWREGSLCPRLAAAGFAVCALDVRGVGDLRPEVGRGNQGYALSHAREEAYAWASLILGKPMLGQRVEDLAAAARALKPYAGGGRRLVLAARGSLAVPALCAAALAPEIDAVYLAGGLISWSSLLEVDDYREPFANFLPGVLKRTDLPFIARSVLPRSVIIAGAVDGAGKTVDRETAARLYGADVDVRPQADWGIDVFSRL
jgi:pimeloyl-ACP methyl ester carboxylesterase